MATLRIATADRQVGETVEDYLDRLQGGCDEAYALCMKYVRQGFSNEVLDEVLGLPNGTIGHALQDARSDDSPYLPWFIAISRARAANTARVHGLVQNLLSDVGKLRRESRDPDNHMPVDDRRKVVATSAGILTRLSRMVHPDALHGTRTIREGLDDSNLDLAMKPAANKWDAEAKKSLGQLLESMPGDSHVSPDLLGREIDGEDTTD